MLALALAVWAWLQPCPLVPGYSKCPPPRPGRRGLDLAPTPRATGYWGVGRALGSGLTPPVSQAAAGGGYAGL